MKSMNSKWVALVLIVLCGPSYALSHADSNDGRWVEIPGEAVGQPNSVCSVFRPFSPADAPAPVASAPVTPPAPAKQGKAAEPVPQGYTSKSPAHFCTTDSNAWNFPSSCNCGGAPWIYNEKNGLCQARFCTPEETSRRADCVYRKVAQSK